MHDSNLEHIHFGRSEDQPQGGAAAQEPTLTLDDSGECVWAVGS